MSRMGFLAGVRRAADAVQLGARLWYPEQSRPTCPYYPWPTTPKPRRMWVKLLRLFLAKFLKSRIAAELIEHGIEPKQRRSERWHGFSEGAFIRYRQKFS